MLKRGINREIIYNNNSRILELAGEYKLAKEAGLPLELADLISFYSCGYIEVARVLVEVAKRLKSTTELQEYVKSIGCWGDGSSQDISSSLAEYHRV